MKGLGAAGATTVSLSVDDGFAQDAQAIAPLIGVGIVGASIGVGWALREFNVVGSDAPPEGLTADALHQEVYAAALKREKNNKSTFVDNRNIIDGIRHTAYTDAKIAAIEELNAGSTESAVLDAANAAVDSYFTTIQKNLLKSWNATAAEFGNLVSAIRSHSNLSWGDVFTQGKHTHTDFNYYVAHQDSSHTDWTIGSNNDTSDTYTLADGTDFTVGAIGFDYGTKGSVVYNPTNGYGGNTLQMSSAPLIGLDGSEADMTQLSGFINLKNNLETAYQNVSAGISTWVTNVYGQVQSGQIEITDLVTPRERAAMMAQEEGMSQAIADLIALNVPVDAEREATITIQNTGAKLPGTFALTDSTDGPIESGTTYDPSTFTGDVYFTADMSLVEGDWTAINTSVDGGNITITSEPYEGTAIEVTTAAGETVSVPAADWMDNDDGTWTYDASADLETTITNVSSARFVSTATETQYETLQLQGSFTVNKLMNTQTGEEVTTTSFTNSEPQTDSNYITQDEWDQLEQQNQELIEKYENSQSGGGVDLGQFDMWGIPGEIVAVVAAVLVALGVLSN